MAKKVDSRTHSFANYNYLCRCSIAQQSHKTHNISNFILFFMKNIKHLLIAAVALIAGFAVSACTPDPTHEDGKDTKVEVVVTDVAANGATISVTTKNVKEFAYIQRDTEIPATAILQSDEFKTVIEDTETEKTTSITITGCEAGKTYTYFFAFRLADSSIYEEVKRVEFTTTSYGDNVLTVVDRMYDGFSVHIQIPDEVKERGNALRYSTSSMAMFNYMKSMGTGSYDNLLYNAAQWTTTDKTVIYDEAHSTETDENGDFIYDDQGNLISASFADPKVPGEPGYFIVGEFAYMDDTEERTVLYIDEETGEIKSKVVNDDSYWESTVWWFPAGWQAGYYNPLYDWVTWYNEKDSDEYDTEKYWTGYYERLYVETLPAETLEGNVEIKVTDVTPIDACISFTPTDDVVQYCILVCTESEYQTQILPLIENNEEHLRWFTGSYFAMMSFGIQMGQGNSELWLTDWFVDTKGMAGQTIRVLVSGIGDAQGKTQCFATTTFEMPEVTLPKPEVVITPVPSDDPYTVTFNIKNPNPDNAITEAYFACNYEREFNNILKEYSYTSLLKEMGNRLDATSVGLINSANGFNFTISSRENATTRLAMLVYNWEGTGNNPDDPNTKAVAEYTTPNANFPVRVNSELFEKLKGEWVASAEMKNYVAVTDSEGNATGEYKYESAGTYTSPVTIAGGIEYPTTLPEEVYDIYADWGISRENTDELYEEFLAMAEQYNARTRGFNRLLCLGFNFAHPDYNLDIVQTPYDLFISDEFSVATVADMFYDFGPKWNLEIDAEGNVWLPINIEREFPMSAFFYGIDYTFYMLAIGERSYLGGDVIGADGSTVIKARFPVEVSDDYNTITIKPIEYTDGYGMTEVYYPCVTQLQNGYATPLNPRVRSEIVLTRKAGTSAAKANVATSKGVSKPVSAVGKAPVPMKRAEFSVTSFENITPRTKLVPERKIEAGVEAYHKRAKAAVEAYYGIKL